MVDEHLTIDLTMAELREVAAYAVLCAEPAVALFERVCPDDRRVRDAVDAARTFAEGADRTKAIRDSAWAAQRAYQETRDAAAAQSRAAQPAGKARASLAAGELAAGEPAAGGLAAEGLAAGGLAARDLAAASAAARDLAAASAAARAGVAAASAAFLHPLAKATQVLHILGAAAHAARALEIEAGDDRQVGGDSIERAARLAGPVVVSVLARYPGAPAGRGRVGELLRRLDAALRRPH